MDDLGFIILRHINSELTNNYWIDCYNSIRNFYNNKIIIIDDESNYNYITEIELKNAIIIKSEYPKKREILPYIYYLKYNFFKTAVILQDSVFINKYVDFNINNNFKFLWNFESQLGGCISVERQIEILNDIKDMELLNYFMNLNWTGCFGVMCIIKYTYLSKINNKYNLFNLMTYINSRKDACALERIFACLLQIEKEEQDKDIVLLGNIYKYIKWGIKYEEKDKFKHLPLIKIWTGR